MFKLPNLPLAAASVLMLSACGGQSESFIPGEWELEAWMESEGNDARLEPRTHTVTVNEDLASMGPHTAVFTRFYRGTKGLNVQFADGVISGYLDQSAVTPFPEHQQEVGGWYHSEAFEMRIKLPKLGPFQPYHVVKGKLVKRDRNAVTF